WQRHVHEFTFALNLAASAILAATAYVTFVHYRFEGGDNFVYYLLRSMVRANDWLGLAAPIPGVAIDSHPKFGNIVGIEVAWFVPLLAGTLLLYCGARSLRRSKWYPLGPLSRFLAIFALPAAFIAVLSITWKFRPKVLESLSQWSEPIVVFFLAELFAM